MVVTPNTPVNGVHVQLFPTRRTIRGDVADCRGDGVSMADVPATLAATLTRIRRDQRLSYAHIGRVGRLSRNTIKQIADGKTADPSGETLCRIALGLAVDPYTGQINQDTLAMSLRALGAAAGHTDLRGELVEQTLPVLLAAVIGDRERAAAWVALIAAHPDVEPDAVRPSVEQLAHRRRRAGAAPRRDAPS